jgi:hypothetical protein
MLKRGVDGRGGGGGSLLYLLHLPWQVGEVSCRRLCTQDTTPPPSSICLFLYLPLSRSKLDGGVDEKIRTRCVEQEFDNCSHYLPPVLFTPVASLPPASMTLLATLSMTLEKLVEKIAAGVVDTGGVRRRLGQNRVTWKTPSSRAFVPLQEPVVVLASYVPHTQIQV